MEKAIAELDKIYADTELLRNAKEQVGMLKPLLQKEYLMAACKTSMP